MYPPLRVRSGPSLAARTTMVSLLTVHTSPMVSFACETVSTVIVGCCVGVTASVGCSVAVTASVGCSVVVNARVAVSTAGTASTGDDTGARAKLRQAIVLCFYKSSYFLYGGILAHAVVGVCIDDIRRSDDTHFIESQC